MKKEEALKRAAALCSKNEKCVSEIETKLYEWGCPPEDQLGIIELLKQEKFIDEERYADSFVRSKFRQNKWGKTKISYILAQKKISNALISKALLQINDKEYFETLKNIIKQKEKTTHFKDDYDKKAKLYRFAVSKGFENEIITQIIQQDNV